MITRKLGNIQGALFLAFITAVLSTSLCHAADYAYINAFYDKYGWGGPTHDIWYDNADDNSGLSYDSLSASGKDLVVWDGYVDLNTRTAQLNNRAGSSVTPNGEWVDNPNGDWVYQTARIYEELSFYDAGLFNKQTFKVYVNVINNVTSSFAEGEDAINSFGSGYSLNNGESFWYGSGTDFYWDTVTANQPYQYAIEFNAKMRPAGYTWPSDWFLNSEFSYSYSCPDPEVQLVVIPEPSSMAMIGLVGVCGLFVRRRFLI